MDQADVQALKARSREIRRLIIRSIYAAQTGHAGPSLSMVEILAILYFRHLRYDPRSPRSPARDYVILSKGHGAPGLYSTLARAGVIEEAELSTLRRIGSRLHGHPHATALPGIDVSTGSLGQGLSIALGVALAWRMDAAANRVYCVLGDGELQEGQNWEAAMSAAKWNLSSVVAILDHNKMQSDGHINTVMPLGDVAAKWRAFGWRVLSVDGHSFPELDAALEEAKTGGAPVLIIANTIKGRGVSFMEGAVQWHHHPLNEAQFAQAMSELAEVDV